MNIYVGNLAREVTEDDLRQAFEAFGQVKNEAQTAIEEMNDKDLKGRTVNVNEARPKVDRGGGRGGRGGFGGGGGRGGRGGGGRRY
ncbi:MAG: RNA recognition motif domain-containing protein [Planctomycetota bacterium]|jgi:RNA recognition motif-containing protein